MSLANRLIADLPLPERSLLLEHSDSVELTLHEVLLQAGESSECVWFPVEGWVAQMLPLLHAGRVSTASTDMGLRSGSGLGIAMVGNEGMFDTSLLLGARRSNLLCRVQAAGRAFRLGREALQQLLQERPAIRERLHCYVHVRQLQLAQQALCMNYHAVEQRLVRCLLMARDRMHSNELFLTHDVLAPLLGVRRESVTQAASTLQRRGLISYSRGYLMLLDEPALQVLACGCYQADLARYKESLGPAEASILSGTDVRSGSEASPEVSQQSCEGLGLLHGAQVRGVQTAQLGASDASRNLL